MLNIIQFLWSAMLISVLVFFVILGVYALGCLFVISCRKFKEVWNDDDPKP